MIRYILDTNMVSHLVRAHPLVLERVQSEPMNELGISVITEAELRYGLAKRPGATRLHAIVSECLKRLTALPWLSETAVCYAKARVDLEKQGKSLATLDLQIAAHAMQVQAILVTNDAAFRHVPGLRCEDWTKTLT